MNIIIIGCGKIGSYLATQLNKEGHSITIIDKKESVVRNLVSKLDIMGVTGNGGMLEVQKEAGIENADLLIAVTSQDELNMLCCLIAKKEANIHTIARIRNPEYEEEVEYLKQQLDLALVLNPEKMVAEEITRLLQFSSALETDTFSQGRVERIKVQVTRRSPLAGLVLRDLPRHFRSNVLISLIERQDQVIIPTGLSTIMEGDAISILAPQKDLYSFMRESKLDYLRDRNVMVIGGGRISYYLAQEAKNQALNLKIIERDEERALYLADNFPNVTVINGSGNDRTLLQEEGLDRMDAFLTLTGIDEENVISSLFAKKHSNAHVITKVNHLDFEELVNDVEIGSVVSPKGVVADEVVRYARAVESSMDSNFEALYKLAGGKAEACEFIINAPSRLTDVQLMNMKLKQNVLIGAIVRKGEFIRPKGSDELMVGDHVIIITTNTGFHDLEDILA